MSIGMTYEQYWYGDVWMVEAFREADQRRRQRKSEELWMQGLYNFNAFSTAIGNAFRKKGTRPEKYMEEPIRVIPYSEEEKAVIAERERQKAIEYFNLLAKKWEAKNNGNG